MNSFVLLPVETWVEILSHCNISEISSFGRTCKFCYELAGNNFLWEKKLKEQWPETILKEEECNLHNKDLYYKWNFEQWLKKSQNRTHIKGTDVRRSQVVQNGAKHDQFTDSFIGASPFEITHGAFALSLGHTLLYPGVHIFTGIGDMLNTHRGKIEVQQLKRNSRITVLIDSPKFKIQIDFCQYLTMYCSG